MRLVPDESLADFLAVFDDAVGSEVLEIVSDVLIRLQTRRESFGRDMSAEARPALV